MTQVLPQVSCCRSGGVIEDPLPQEIQLHPAVPTPLDELRKSTSRGFPDVRGGAIQASRDTDHETSDVPCDAWRNAQGGSAAAGCRFGPWGSMIACTSRWHSCMGRVLHVACALSHSESSIDGGGQGHVQGAGRRASVQT